MLTLSNQQPKGTIVKNALSKKPNLKLCYKLKLSNDYSLTLIRNKSNNLMIDIAKNNGTSIFNTNIDLNKFEPDFFEKILKAFHKIRVDGRIENGTEKKMPRQNKSILDEQIQGIKNYMVTNPSNNSFKYIIFPKISKNTNEINFPVHLQHISSDVQYAHQIVDTIAEEKNQLKHAIKFNEGEEYCGEIKYEVPHGGGVLVTAYNEVKQGIFRYGQFYNGISYSKLSKNDFTVFEKGKIIGRF